jgi:hypothetical protein
MLNKTILTVLCILMSASTYTMNNNWKLIKKWGDLKPFAGKIVTYVSSSHYIKKKDDYRLRNSNFNYGYIEKNTSYWFYTETGYRLGDKPVGYNMSPLIKNKCGDRNIPLTNREITHQLLCIRKVNPQEAKKIIKNLISKKAKFANTWENKEQEIISSLQLIAQKNKKNKE